MIRVRLSAALAVRDGFTGKPMAQNAVGCILDGQVCHPGYRPGGYLIFTNLAPGPHTVVLRGGRYRDEKIPFPALKDIGYVRVPTPTCIGTHIFVFTQFCR